MEKMETIYEELYTQGNRQGHQLQGLPCGASVRRQPDRTMGHIPFQLDMMDALDAFNKRNGYTLQMRIGINSGAVVAGVIGKRKFLYDLWGDVVNTASRMESDGVAGRIQVTDATRQRLGEPFMLEKRGVIDVKGKGEMHTGFLNSRKDS